MRPALHPSGQAGSPDIESISAEPIGDSGCTPRRYHAMSDDTGDVQSAPLILERLTLKGKGLLDLCLELDKNLCVKGFIDVQVERGGEYIHVVEAMRDHIDIELASKPHGRRRELLLDLQRYVALQLETAQAIDIPVEPG
jgi:hypothetical protein